MAAAIRTFWKGHLRLALVSIPVRLVAAEKTAAEIQLHQVDRKSRQRIRYVKVAPGRGEVRKEDIVMAYEIEPGNYVFLEDDDLNALRISSKHTIELTQFVDVDDIDPLYFERPYYVLPDGEVAEEGYRVLRDALRAKRKCGVGQLTLRGKENLVALYPGGNGLILETLRYEADIKDADEIFTNLGKGALPKEMVNMAEQLIDQRADTFKPDAFKNRYADALRDFVRSKLSSGDTVAVDESERPEDGKVIDFMEALKRSVAGEKTSAKKVSPSAAKTKSTSGPRTKKSPTTTPTKRKKHA